MEFTKRSLGRGACVVLLAAFTIAASQEGVDLGSYEEAPPAELEPLAALAGEWTIETLFLDREGSVTGRGSAYASIEPDLAGLGVRIHERHPTPRAEAAVFASTLVLGMRPGTGEIVGVSSNTLGNRKYVSGHRTASGYLLEQSGELFEGAPGLNRLRLEIRDADYFEMQIEHCPERPEDCQKNYVARYSRSAAE